MAIHSPLRRGGVSHRQVARGWGFKFEKLNIG